MLKQIHHSILRRKCIYILDIVTRSISKPEVVVKILSAPEAVVCFSGPVLLPTVAQAWRKQKHKTHANIPLPKPYAA